MGERVTHTCSTPESRLRHRSGKSSDPYVGVSAAHRYQGNGHRRTCRAGGLCDWCHLGLHALCDVPAPYDYTTSVHGKRSAGKE